MYNSLSHLMVCIMEWVRFRVSILVDGPFFMALYRENNINFIVEDFEGFYFQVYFRGA